MVNKKQGKQANLNGKVVESMLEPIFKANGFAIFDNSEVVKNPSVLENLPRYVLRNVPFETVYGSSGKTEFVIVDTESGRRIRIESKYQASAGSVDEKFPYMFLNGVYKYPENEVIFIVDGGGYKSSAREWIQNSIDTNWLDFRSRGKDIKLMNISDFVNWFNHEF